MFAAGCSSSSEQPSPAPTNAEQDSSESAGGSWSNPIEPAQHRADWDWKRIGPTGSEGNRLSMGSRFTASFDGRYLADPYRSSDDSAVIVDTTTDKVVGRYVMDGSDVRQGWRIGEVQVDAPWVVVLESNGDDSVPREQKGTRAYRLDLRSGEQTFLNELDGFPPTGPGTWWGYADGTLTYGSEDYSTRTSCLVAVDIEALSWEKYGCTRNAFVDRPNIGADGKITYQLQAEPKNGAQPCVKLMHLDLADGPDAKPTEHPLHKDCIGFSGVPGADYTVWSEVGLHSAMIAESKATARLADGRIADLGTATTGSISWCDGWVYWQQPGDIVKLVRWQPGSDIEQVYTGKDGHILSLPKCGDGWLTLADNSVDSGEITTYTARAPS